MMTALTTARGPKPHNDRLNLRLFTEPDEADSPLTLDVIRGECPEFRLTDLPPIYCDWRSRSRESPLKQETEADYYREAGHWAEATGDPVLWQASPDHCTRFVGWLNEHYSALETKRTKRRLVHILMAFGAPGHHDAWPLGVYGLTPVRVAGQVVQAWPRQPPHLGIPAAADSPEKPFWTIEHLRKFLAACHRATYPVVGTCTAAQWWTSAITVVAGTGIRRRTLLALQRGWLQEAGGNWMLRLPAESLKQARREVVYASRPVRDAIAAMPTGDTVFPLPTDRTPDGRLRRMHDEFQAIAEAAEIPAELRRGAGFHAVRRGLADLLGPEVGQIVLTHADQRTTREHYSRRESRAIEAGPQLEAAMEALNEHPRNDS